MLFSRRPIQARGPDRFVVHLGGEEREVLKAVCEDLSSVLADDEGNPSLRRLFPTSHASDPEVDRAYQALVHDDLLRSRRELLATVAETAERDELDRETLDQWMVALNSVRLVLGTVLDVSEDGPPDLDGDDPELPVWAVYELLGWLVDAAVRALAETLD